MKEEINHLPQFLRSKRQTITYSKRVNYVDAVQAFVVRYYEVINFFIFKYCRQYLILIFVIRRTLE